MERRINKALLLFTIALLSPLGLGMLDAASAPALTESASEAQLTPVSEAVVPPALLARQISKPVIRNAQFTIQHFLSAVATTHTLYVRATAARSTRSTPTAALPLRLALYPGSSAGGLWRLS